MNGHPSSQRLRSQLLSMLKQLHQELLPEDEAVVDAFLNAPHHVTPEEILHRTARPGVDLSQVRRMLRLLCDLGIAQCVRLGDTPVYEHLHLNHHHDHLVCVKCGGIEEFLSNDLERLQDALCRDSGFTPLTHKLEIRGLCRQCRAGTPPTRPLSVCLSGEEVEVTDVVGGKMFQRRMVELGMTPRARLRILRSDGPVTVEVRGSRIALGRQEAARIVVATPVPKEGT